MPLIVLALVALVIGLPIWLIRRAVSACQRLDELTRRLGQAELEIFRLKKTRDAAPPVEPAHPPTSADSPIAQILQTRREVPPEIIPEPPAISAEPPAITPPPWQTEAPTYEAPPLIPPEMNPTPPQVTAPRREVVPSINWEQFMGVKLFAWIGGLALFLGVAFFIKYSFDNNLISPELRVAIGFLTGLGLLVGGVLISRKDYVVLSQTFCATGVVVLYAVTFACRSIYHFEFFGPLATFLLMTLITTTAFLLAVRLNALVVAILGMLGGFLTPILLSTGQDNPFGLFGYIAILDAGLIAVALYRRWFFLTALGALGTVIMQIGWAGKFFESEKYFDGNKILITLGVLLGFNALYLAAAWWTKRREKIDWFLAGSAVGLAAVALAFTAWFLSFEPLALRPWLMFGFVFLIDLGIALLALLDDDAAPAQPVTGLAVFGLLALWTTRSLTDDLLNPALVFYLVFAVMHSGFPAFLKHRRGVNTASWGSQIFPPLALILVLIPIFNLAQVSFIVWPFVFLIDLLAIGLAVLTASLLPVFAVLLLTLAATGALIFKIPTDLTGLPTSFFLLGAFAIFFVVVGVWAARKFKPALLTTGSQINSDFGRPETLAALLPAASAVLPFLLLIMATLRLQLANPSPVFGLALLLVVVLMGLSRMFSMEGLPAIGLVCVAALECAWHFNRISPTSATLPLIWYLIFFGVFALFPFVFLRQLSERTIPWAAAALAGLPQFFFIYSLVSDAYPNDFMGLLPAAFAIPALLSLVVVLKQIPETSPARMTQLAWFGGVGLFFITLIFPIQFERQWITIGWALEGAALLWLFHRVPHPGLRLTGVGLLIAAFARLAVNPLVLEYQARSATPILNWYLYTYGIVTVCLFVGARLLAPPRHLVLQNNMPPVLAGLGTVLAFLLLNIEIADFFSAPGSTLTFQFSGDFARDMTYSIAWALFALVLLVVGIAKKIPASRYAALGLLSVTLLKLFFHDLSRLGPLYRIGAFIGVAVIAMIASFAYQRFYSVGLKEKESSNEITS